MISTVIDFGRKYNFGRGRGHAFKVRDLALKIFDEAGRLGLHDMGFRERFWLEAAALLHDVGVSVGGEHHESSRRLIISSSELREVLDSLDLEAIAWIAFFHRDEPDPLEYLDSGWRRFFESEYGGAVVRLAAILRIADALDRSLLQLVNDVELERSGDRILLKVFSKEKIPREINRVREKAGLLERVFNIKLEERIFWVKDCLVDFLTIF